jgi:hypothetical protein
MQRRQLHNTTTSPGPRALQRQHYMDQSGSITHRPPPKHQQQCRRAIEARTAFRVVRKTPKQPGTSLVGLKCYKDLNYSHSDQVKRSKKRQMIATHARLWIRTRRRSLSALASDSISSSRCSCMTISSGRQLLEDGLLRHRYGISSTRLTNLSRQKH